MARFFITYHIHDENTKTEFVRRLKKAFPNDHFQVDDEQTYSDEWWEEVRGEIQRSDIFIYLLSQKSYKDEKSKAEFSEAQRWKRPIIAVNLSKKEKIFLTDNADDVTYIPISDFDSLIGKINQQKEHLPDKDIIPIRDMPTLKPKNPKTIPIYHKTKKMKKGLLIPLIIITITVISVFMINSRNNTPLEQPPALGYPGGDMVKQNTDWRPVERDFNGVTMVFVPRGCFMMGSNHNDDSDEKPIHEQCFEMPFWIDKYEVSQLQFSSFGAEKAKQNGFNGSSRPVENITWFEARSFCELRGMRLPTEREWEYASRGPSNLIYPWGNDFSANNVAYNGTTDRQTSIIGIRINGVSWVGAFDLSGNVWEWVSSLYYPYPYDIYDEDNNYNTTNRVLRGGSWYDGQDKIYTSYRDGRNPNSEYNDGGFRCARDYEP